MHSRDLFKMPYRTTGIVKVGEDVKSEETRMVSEGMGVIKIGKHTELFQCSFLAEDGSVIHISDGCNLAGLVIVCGKGSCVYIGNGTEIHGDFWGRCTIHSRDGKKVEIGKDCLLSGNIIIRNNDGHPVVGKDGRRTNESQDTCIGNHVWVCEGARILKGVQTGNNVIIGNSAVVTSKSPGEDNIIMAGNPAKKIRDLDSQETWNRF